MNKLTTADRVRIVAALVEGNSIRATCRMTGFVKGTVLARPAYRLGADVLDLPEQGDARPDMQAFVVG